jgi:transposase
VEGRRAANTRARHGQIHALAVNGLTLTAICQTLNLDPKTVRRYLRTADADQMPGPSGGGRGPLTTHQPYLNGRFAEGATNAVRLWEEIHARGYRGSRRSVRRHLATLRTPATQPPRPTEPKVRQVRAWIMRRPEELTNEDRERLDAVCARSPIMAATTNLARNFADLLRRLRGHELITRVKTAEDSGIPELAAFTTGLRGDWDAVTAGLTLRHNSGPVEGHLNRIKMIKRTMYGRANLDLLRRRVLLAN